MSRARFTRKSTPSDLLMVNDWPAISTQLFSDKQKARITDLSYAIQEYAAGKKITAFLRDHLISWEEFHRAFNRCIAYDDNGRQFCWRGLLPNLRTKTPCREKPLEQSGRNGRGGLSGALQVLFKNHPTIQYDFDKYIYQNAKRILGNESKIRHKSAHQFLVKLCKEAGITNLQWPLNTKKYGRGSAHLYVDRFLHARYDDIVATQYGSKAKAKSNTGTGFYSRFTASRALDVVELDEHKCHFIGCIGIPTPNGLRWLVMPRASIILAADRKLGTILGYKVIFDRDADAEDVLEVLHSICCGGRPTNLYKTEKCYAAGRGGFPVDLGGAFEWCSFNQLLLDNALIHLASSVINRAREIMGFDINYGPVARFERRPNVEGIFSELIRAGFHRVQSTTGTGPMDPLRQNAEKSALNQKFALEEVQNLLEAIIADHNGKKGKRNFGYGPLQQLDSLVKDDDQFGMIFPQLPILPVGIAPLNISIVPMKICGNEKKGRRPSVYYQEEEYFGIDLKNRLDLIGQQVFAHIHRDDIRAFDLFNTSGEKIAAVTVRGRWRHSPHSSDLRRIINKLIQDGRLEVGYDEDPINVHLKEMGERIGSEKRKNDAVTQNAAALYAKHSQSSNSSSSIAVNTTMKNACDEDELDDPAVKAIFSAENKTLDDLYAFNGEF